MMAIGVLWILEKICQIFPMFEVKSGYANDVLCFMIFCCACTPDIFFVWHMLKAVDKYLEMDHEDVLFE